MQRLVIIVALALCLCFSAVVDSAPTSSQWHAGDPAAPTPAMYSQALKYISSMCDGVTANGCNSFQLPMFSGGSFVPSLLADVTTDKIFLDTTESRSSDNYVSLDESASSVTTSDASGFGIGASVPFKGIMFSLGLQHEKLVNTMNSDHMVNYYAEISRTYTVFTATLNHTVALRDAVAQAASALPNNCGNSSEKGQWLSFFSKYGTHYVKSATFGGTMKMYTFLQSTVKDDSKVSSSDWNFNLGAQFDKNAGINFTWPSSSSEDSFNAFSKYTFNQQFFSIGGDQSAPDYKSWLTTVKQNPAPIRTTLGSMKDLIPAGKDYDTAFSTYLTQCPHTDKGICNGYGGCNFEQQLCECSSGTYADADGNCYPNCQDNCNNNGQCSYGACKCNVNGDGFGFSGTTCDTKCGTKTYDAGSGNCWCVPGDNSLIMDRCTSATCDNNAGATCLCQAVSGYSDSDMVASYADSQSTDDTYKCDAHDNHCSQTWPWDTCNCHEVITCKYGQGNDCPSDGQLLLARNASGLHMGTAKRTHKRARSHWHTNSTKRQ